MDKAALNFFIAEYFERMDDTQRLTFADIEGLTDPEDSEISQVTEYKQNAFLSLTDDASRILDVEFQDLIDWWMNNTTTYFV